MKRSVAFILCLSLLLSTFILQIPGVVASEKSVRILYNGKQTDELTVQQNEKEVLTVETAGIGEGSYQWQLLMDHQNSVWVDIYDKTDDRCEISYALLKNLLDEANSTYIRCAVTSGDEVLYSDAVCVTVAPAYYAESTATSYAGIDQTQSVTPVFKLRAAAAASEYVTITVKYLDMSSLTGDESAIYSPYTATIERGTGFNQNVVSPTFLGFAPYYAKDTDGIIDDDASMLTFNLENVTENVEVKVYYRPIEVNFVVRYYFQNINDDLYTENVSLYHSGKAETGTIIEDEYLREHAGDTRGFEKMYHVPQTVAADGSTVFECYYDRNYYLIQFDLDGGYGVDPIYARYGTPFIVNNPVKHGYSFAGWDRLYDTDGDGAPDTGNGQADATESTIGTENIMYRALWKSVNTTYTIAYWAVSDSGNEYIGSRRIEDALSGDYVSGKDDLEKEYRNIYRFEEHTHSEEEGCYGNCVFKDHKHSIECYTTATLRLAENLTGTERTVFDDLRNSVRTLTDGNVYRYRYRRNSYYNFFYLAGTWYYLGTNDTYNGVNVSGLGNPTSNNTFTTAAATMICPSVSHTHTDECLSCTKLAHIHSDECYTNPRYYEFDRADQDVTVEGDGSTIVNVYYKPKEYTLRFYYARSSVSGNDTVYQVVGGSTYAFGGLGADNAADLSVGELLGRVPAGNWGKVEELPKWYTDTELSGSTSDTSQYKLGQLKSGVYTYYYFDFTARYGENISTKWPIGILSPVKTVETHGQHNYKYTDANGNEISAIIKPEDDYKYAYFSAWNGEYKVKYTQEHLNASTSPYQSDNQTIKGRYMVLDENLLYDAKFEDSNIVSFLGFWDNGANVEWSVPKLFRYHLMLEAPAGTVTEYEYDGKYYTLFQEFRTFDDSTVKSQTPTTINGFEYVDLTWTRNEGGYTSVMGETLRDAYDVYFWYNRNDYTLTYFNYENVLNAVSVPYDTLFTTEEFYKEPERYPPSLEPNAYEFVGWYNSPVRIYPIEFDKDRMPGENIVWYAKWVPVKHNVNFFNTYDEMLAYENGGSSVEPYKAFSDVDHRTIVGSVDNPVRVGDGNVDLIFSGWFYMENGEKKAFSPLNMPINRDMDIFADWSSSSPQPYNIQYVLMENPDEKVADDTFGFAYAGSTRTFIAKAGNPYNQLYDKYNSGFFPTVASHSITMQYEEDKDHLQSNVSTFYYVEARDIEYTVRYVNKETNIVMDEDTWTTSDAVVTERFRAYPNMVPDAFYKRLVLSVEYDEETGKYVGSKDNVITFYYTENDASAYYAVHFMLEKLGATEADKQNFAYDGSGGYAESVAHVEGIGDIGSSVSITPQEFAGFKLIPDKAVSVIGTSEENSPYNGSQYTIEVTESGTELYIFYERLDYEYTVHYYRYNTTEKLADDKTGAMPYGSSVTETALGIPGYTCVSAQTQTIAVRNDSNQNVIIFYYAPVQYVAEYVPVPSDGGRLSSTIEVVTGEEDLKGSVPTENPYYSFEGWYMDEACTVSAAEYGTIDETDNRFTPDKDKLSETDHNIFYAKFTRRAGDLTIVRNDAEDNGQVFVYEVKNNSDESIITVTVTGNGSVTIHDLPFGEYTVTQQNDWSWRYDDEAVIADHQGAEGTTVQFPKPAISDKWLNGNSALVKNQRGKSE